MGGVEISNEISFDILFDIGTHLVYLVVTDDEGEMDSDLVIITIEELQQAN